MNRRDWLRRAALIAVGTVAADQVELLERLTHRRRFWPGWTPPTRASLFVTSDPFIRIDATAYSLGGTMDVWAVTPRGTWKIADNVAVPHAGDRIAVSLSGSRLFVNGREVPT